MRSYIAGLLTGSPAYWDVDGSKVYTCKQLRAFSKRQKMDFGRDTQRSSRETDALVFAHVLAS